MVPCRHVFIDLDDTLWDFRKNSYNALKCVYHDFKLVDYYPAFDDFYRVYSEKNTELWSLYHHGRITRDELTVERFRYPLQRIGVYDPKVIPQLNQAYLSELSEQVGLSFYARELLQYLAPRYTLTLLSNGFREVQYKKLDRTGIRRFFDHIVLSDEVGYMKPDARIFHYALDRLGAAPCEAVMIGDNFEADICGAARVGLAQIYYNPLALPLPPSSDGRTSPVNRAHAGHASERFSVSCPTYQVSSLQEILTLL